MKTTIDLPDALFRRAKIMAAKRNTSLKNLVIEGLQNILNLPSASDPDVAGCDETLFETDAYGAPVMKPRGGKVTNQLINPIREREGI